MPVSGGVDIFYSVFGLLFDVGRILEGFVVWFVGYVVGGVQCIACVLVFVPLVLLPWVVVG